MQETPNALLDEEADEMVGAERYERTAAREAYRSGHYKRKLVATSGEVVLDAPKLRGATFQTAVIERYRRRETGVEEAIIEMYLAGVSCAPYRGRLLDSVGRGRLGRNRVEPQREGVRKRGCLAVQAAFRRATRTRSSTAYT